MAVAKPAEDAIGVVRVEGAGRRGAFVVLCDHASNRIPDGFGDPLVSAEDMERHIAWDPGALGVARGIARRLDAPLLYPDASRLLVDCNRPPGARDSIATFSETTAIPGNRDLPPEVRGRRLGLIYDAYHEAIDDIVSARRRQDAALIAVHSFTPVYRGQMRPWHVGIVVDDDRRLADPMLEILRGEVGLVVGENQPYSPADGVYHTLERHATPRRARAVMIEIRNDAIATPTQQEAWAERLTAAIRAAPAPGGPT